MAISTSGAGFSPATTAATDSLQSKIPTHDFGEFAFTPVEDFLAEDPAAFGLVPKKKKKSMSASTAASANAAFLAPEVSAPSTVGTVSDDGEPPPYVSMEPTFISSSIATTHVKDLYELCQSHVSLTPTFHFTATETTPQMFSVVLKLVGGEELKELRAEGLYSSKKHAKEAAAALAIDYVKSLPQNQTAKHIPLAEVTDADKPWVQDLNLFCMNKKVKPQYFDFATAGAGFSCEIILPPELEIPELQGKVFGDRHKGYRSKRSAKLMAAKEAMNWLNGLAPPENASRNNSSSKKSKTTIVGKGGKIGVPVNATPSQAINIICPKLGIMSPEYHLDPCPHMQGVYDVRAIVKRPNGPKPALIGPIDNVHGKKKAKEKIAESVYLWLKKIAQAKGINIVETEDDEDTE
ncbi:hypothetical protein RUND412_000311 [Rhizina undulata]